MWFTASGVVVFVMTMLSFITLKVIHIEHGLHQVISAAFNAWLMSVFIAIIVLCVAMLTRSHHRAKLISVSTGYLLGAVIGLFAGAIGVATYKEYLIGQVQKDFTGLEAKVSRFEAEHKRPPKTASELGVLVGTRSSSLHETCSEWSWTAHEEKWGIYTECDFERELGNSMHYTVTRVIYRSDTKRWHSGDKHCCFNGSSDLELAPQIAREVTF